MTEDKTTEDPLIGALLNQVRDWCRLAKRHRNAAAELGDENEEEQTLNIVEAERLEKCARDIEKLIEEIIR